MKFFVAFALFVAVASADFTKPTPVTAEMAEIQEIIAAINSPSTNPDTAAALEALLLDVLGIKPEPIEVGPAVIDFPVPEEALAPSPAIVDPSPVATTKSPLVQIIVNVNSAASNPAAVPGVVEPVDVIDVMPVVPEPVDVVDEAEVVEPVDVVDVMPVDVIDVMPVVPEPSPIDPSPAVVLPDDLN